MSTISSSEIPGRPGPAVDTANASCDTIASHGDSKTAGPLGRWARDLMMLLGIRFFYERATAWLYAYDCGELPGAAHRG
ncbi:hypothetical protein K388_04009 [Streptomyces sp. KhCrAH-43]|nr:hypothetical protein K388_04009 [Streptomyces sp. KhCrAH-43]